MNFRAVFLALRGISGKILLDCDGIGRCFAASEREREMRFRSINNRNFEDNLRIRGENMARICRVLGK